jgi:hypothetical protein
MPMRVGVPSVRSDRRTSNRLDRAEPPEAMAANSALRRREGRRATLAASDRQPGASLRSTASEHAAAGLRRHAGEEAVLTLACALLGLIRPLHACPKSFWWFIVAPADNTRTAGRSASHVQRMEPVPDSVSDSIRRARKGVKRPHPGGSMARIGSGKSIAPGRRRLLHYADSRGPTPLITEGPGDPNGYS